MSKTEDCEVLWNYLPAGDVYALVELDEDLLEFFNLVGEYSQLIISKNNPKNAYVIQGEVVFINHVTQEVYWTQETACVLNEDIISYYKEPLLCLQQPLCLT